MYIKAFEKNFKFFFNPFGGRTDVYSLNISVLRDFVFVSFDILVVWSNLQLLHTF